MMKKKEISVGYSGKAQDLDLLLDSCKDLYSVYTGGLAGKIAGGRPLYLDSLDTLADNCAKAHKKGVSYEIALNAPCGLESKSNTEWWEKIRSYIRELEQCGVDYIIASHPFIMQTVKEHTNMKVVASTICEIMTGRSASYYEKIGADIIIPSMNVNYNMKALEEIKESLDHAILRIMVNEHCLGDCPWRRFHHNHYSHHNEEFEYHVNCKTMFYKNPYLLLTNNYIRPEDIHNYEKLTHQFKVVGRLNPINDLIEIIQAYENESYDGNCVKLFDLSLEKQFNVPNKMLEGLFERKIKCNKLCDKCGNCNRLWNEIKAQTEN